MQGQCKPNAIELARIAEVQPVLAFHDAKVLCFSTRNKYKSELFAQTVLFFDVCQWRTDKSAMLLLNSSINKTFVPSFATSHRW